jgi:hypothetical protein
MNEEWKEEYEALPKAGSHRLIDFEQANVVTDRPPAFPPQFLMVSGSKPYANMWVVRRSPQGQSVVVLVGQGSGN